MTTGIVGSTRPSPLLCTLLATPLLLTLGACEIAPELLEEGKLGLAGAGGSAASGGRGGQAGQAGQPGKDEPPSAGNAGTEPETGRPPNAGGVACSMREDGKQVCVVCTDASGKVVREGCSPAPVPGQMPDCHDVKRSDGSLCTVCFDPASGQNGVAKVSCRPPEHSPCGQPTPPPPMGGITCRDYVENGAKCTICFDAAGKVVRKGCDATVPMPVPDPGMQACKEYEVNGAKCVTCTDASGKVVREGCWGPATPADPTKPNG